MFTGIVTDIGRVRDVRETERDRRYEIQTAWDVSGIDLGASISHAGCCLTVNSVAGQVFSLNIIPHTWDVTTLGRLKAGDPVNLEIDMLARYLARWQETA